MTSRQEAVTKLIVEAATGAFTLVFLALVYWAASYVGGWPFGWDQCLAAALVVTITASVVKGLVRDA